MVHKHVWKFVRNWQEASDSGTEWSLSHCEDCGQSLKKRVTVIG